MESQKEGRGRSEGFLQDLQAWDSRFRNLIECNVDCLMVIDQTGRILYASQASKELFGKDQKDLIGENFGFPLCAGERTEIDVLYPGQGPRVAEMRVVETRWENEIVFLASLRDITERKKIEQTLKHREWENRTLVENSPDLIMRFDSQSRYLFVNSAVERTTGIPCRDFYGKTFEQIGMPEQLCRQWRSELGEVLVTGQESSFEFTFQSVTGDSRIYSAHTVPEKNDMGEVETLLSVARDITELRRAIRALKESENKYATLVKNAKDAVVIIQEQVLKFANPALVEMIHVPLEEAIGSPFEKWISPKKRQEVVKNYEHRIAGEEAPPVYETVLRTKDGVSLPVEISAVRIEFEAKPAILGIVRDISERKRAEEERQKLQEKILQAQKLESLGVMAGGIAHDFNNILLGILGNANLAIEEIPESSPARYSLEQLEKAAQRAAELTRQMLAYSGRGRFVNEPLDLTELVEEMIDLLKVSISKKVDLDCHFGRALPLIEGDPTQMRQIVMNLIMNASESLEEAPGTIHVKTGVEHCDRRYLKSTYLDEDHEEGKYVYIEVQDNGKGMSPEVMKRIFEPFYSTKFTGRGLGLAAVLGIVRSHHGALKVESREKEGSIFKVLFPVPRAQLEKNRKNEILVKKSNLQGTILVVDDEEAVRSFTMRALERAGYRVLLGKDGREGLEVFRDHFREIDLVLLDMTMPRMNGDEVFREMVKIDPNTKVLISSGYDRTQVTQNFSGPCYLGFIQKPYQPKKLLARLEQLLVSG
jgi:two-component system, cell cycle sensor histidine kinase and response regulator CckA